jgi:hypothetical protein
VPEQHNLNLKYINPCKNILPFSHLLRFYHLLKFYHFLVVLWFYSKGYPFFINKILFLSTITPHHTTIVSSTKSFTISCKINLPNTDSTILLLTWPMINLVEYIMGNKTILTTGIKWLQGQETLDVITCLLQQGVSKMPSTHFSYVKNIKTVSRLLVFIRAELSNHLTKREQKLLKSTLRGYKKR